MALLVVATLLYARGWRLADFPVAIGRAATLVGLLAYGASWLLYQALDAGLPAIFASLREGFDAIDGYRPAHPASLPAIYLASLVNPVFEEAIVCGYVIPALSRRFGETTAINVSVVVRGSYHLYQGIAVLPFHLAFGLMQAYLYARLRNLWPLLVAHALGDFVPMVSML